MLKRCYSLILMIVLLSSCAHHQTAVRTTTNAPSTSSKQYRKLHSFNQVDVLGNVNVDLHTGYKIPQLILRGDPRDLAQVRTSVKHNTLYITLDRGYPQYSEVNVEIRGHFLNKFKYVGVGRVSGSKLHSSYLDLYLDNAGTTRLGGSLGLRHLEVGGKSLVQLTGVSSPYLQVELKGTPKVQLVGTMNLASLDVDNGAWFSAYWVKSTNLTLRAREKATIQLAGVVNRLDVELWGAAQFKGRYFRAKRSFVKTHNKSIAEISAINHQSTLATDASDIYYYNHAATRTDFMGFDGSVLDMRQWNPHDPQDATRYNKQFP